MASSLVADEKRLRRDPDELAVGVGEQQARELEAALVDDKPACR